MGSRTAVAAKRTQSRVAFGAACLILASVVAGGCVLGNDNDRPVLAVDPLWDRSAGDRFLGGSCSVADVAWMTWEIQDRRGRVLEKSDELDDCEPLDFIGLLPGTYQLVITGYDADEVARWSTTCTGLVLGRFDRLYTCRVDQIAPDDDRDGAGDEDAGTADAGAG